MSLKINYTNPKENVYNFKNMFVIGLPLDEPLPSNYIEENEERWSKICKTTFRIGNQYEEKYKSENLPGPIYPIEFAYILVDGYEELLRVHSDEYVCSIAKKSYICGGHLFDKLGNYKIVGCYLSKKENCLICDDDIKIDFDKSYIVVKENYNTEPVNNMYNVKIVSFLETDIQKKLEKYQSAS